MDEHGEPWWNYIVRRKLLISHQSSLIILPAEISSSKSEGTGKGNDEFGLTNYLCSYFEGIFNILQNLATWNRRLYFPSEGRCAADINAFKSIVLGQV
jgi:hypothetical protein